VSDLNDSGTSSTGKFCVRITKTCYKILEGDSLGVEKKICIFFFLIYFLLLSKRLKLSSMMKNGI
jgi:hypothetical protein